MPLLLLGEPGTGRTQLARALVQASRRAQGPLVEVDLAAVPTSLFESELFGYRAGAVTAAGRSHAGRVARAAGGTLLLEHVEEMPLAVQPKLLRLLAEQRYAPLGGHETKADVRFVAIGPDDLRQRVERGAFREDLYFRLEVVAFRVPPLRERRDDLALLLESLTADLAERFDRPTAWLSAPAREWMLAYSWPGNLRQLRNVLERALIVAAGPELDPPPPADALEQRPQRLIDVEAREIRRALAYTRGHQEQAARLLGISRKALWEKRKRLGIP